MKDKDLSLALKTLAVLGKSEFKDLKTFSDEVKKFSEIYFANVNDEDVKFAEPDSAVGTRSLNFSKTVTDNGIIFRIKKNLTVDAKRNYAVVSPLQKLTIAKDGESLTICLDTHNAEIYGQREIYEVACKTLTQKGENITYVGKEKDKPQVVISFAIKSGKLAKLDEMKSQSSAETSVTRSNAGKDKND